MTVADLALNRLWEMYIQQDGDMSITYTVHKRLLMEKTNVDGDYLEFVYSDGTTDRVQVDDCHIDKTDGNVDVHGYVNNGQTSRSYMIMPADYYERRNEADEYLWENVM